MIYAPRSHLHTTALAVVTMAMMANGAAHAAVDARLPRVQLKDIASGALLIRDPDAPGVYAEVPITSSKVDITVTGLVTRTIVRQTFTNPSRDFVDATYAFPLAETAAVDELRMVIGARVIEGQIHEKRQAQQIFQHAKRDGKQASLVEQLRANLFTTSLANIPPGDSIEIVIGFSDVLHYDAGRVTLRHPLAVTPRYAPAGAAPLATPMTWQGDVELTVVVEAGFPVARVEAASHKIGVEHMDEATFAVALAHGPIAADRDFVLAWDALPLTAPTAAAFIEEHNGASYVMLMLVPPTEANDSARTPRETIFILDTSGSMSGSSMEQAKLALALAVAKVDERDAFNVIEFDDDWHALWSAPRLATRPLRDDAVNFVQGLQADGGTEMLGALVESFAQLGRSERRDFLGQVVFITDGAVQNEAELFTAIESGLGKTRLFTVGIGAAPNTYFMRKAAESGRGTFTYVASANEVEPKMSELFAKIDSPVLSGIEVDFGQGSTQEVWPQRIGDVYMGEPLVLFAKTGALPRELVITASSAGKPWRMTMQVPAPIKQAGVRKLWARKKVDSLTDAMRTARSSGMEGEILAVALEHHIVSELTSLVAVDVTRAGIVDDTLSSKQQPGALPRGGTSFRLEIMFGMLMLAAAVLLARRVA